MLLRGSGKQVLLRALSELSTQYFEEHELDFATEKMRAAMLMHCSTSPESFKRVSQLAWCSDSEVCDGKRSWQGISIKDKQLPELFNSIRTCPGLAEHIQNEFADFTEDDVDVLLWVIFKLLVSIEMSRNCLRVEDNVLSDHDYHGWIERYSRYFREYESGSDKWG